MTVLSEPSLEFSREHLSKFFDSDFFPRSFVFDALWHSWDEVKQELSSKNVGKLPVGAVRAVPSMKPDRSFRIVHQLEPLDSIVYSALAWTVAPDVERARAPVEDKVACSYRVGLNGGTYFCSGNGYPDFVGAIESHCEECPWVLATDIADFFNQIYLHRVQNALEAANPELRGVSEDIERFLMALRGKSSQGIPVGPAASILMSEAVLSDVDTFLSARGCRHTRYVDDFRIFGDSEDELRRTLEALTEYLYSQHLLSIASDKTRVMPAAAFLLEHIHSKQAQEKVKYIRSLDVFNDYSGEFEDIDLTEEQSQEILKDSLSAATDYLLALPVLDLGLARRILRLGRQYGIEELAPILLKHVDRLLPVVRELALYLATVIPDEKVQAYGPLVIEAVVGGAHKGRLGKLWLDWYLAQLPALHSDKGVSGHLYGSGSVETQALAALSSKNLSWVRAKKAEALGQGPWDRRAVIRTASILPSGERNPWLQHVINNSVTLTDRWLARWVKDTS